MDIKIGSKVRSFDFADGEYGRSLLGGDDERASYVEGRVVDIRGHVHGYDVFEIQVTLDVGGNESHTGKNSRVGAIVTVPVNGTPKSFGGETNAVEFIDNHLEVLNCGGGRQSVPLVLMACHGEIARPDLVIMADTGDEQDETLTYWHEVLVPAMDKAGLRHALVRREHTHKTQQGANKVGNIRRDTLRSVAEGSRIANAPFFVDKGEGKKRGKLKRACTSEYKIDPINKYIKRVIFGLLPGRRMQTKAANRTVNQWIGIATEESQRAGGNSGADWSTLTYPLLKMEMSTADCIAKIKELGYPVPVKSACIGCPFRSDASWARMKSEQPEAFATAVDFDAKLRHPLGRGRLNDGQTEADYADEGHRVKGAAFPAYLHSSLKPLGDVDLPDWTGQDDGAFGGGYC